MNSQGEFSFAPFFQHDAMPKRSPKQPAARAALGQAHPAEADAGGQRGTAQASLDFAGLDRQEGYTRWVAGRRLAAQELMHRLHLPLGHLVEVWLSQGIRLRGRLRLAQEVLFIEEDRIRHLELVIDDVPFTYRDMESCVRLD